MKLIKLHHNHLTASGGNMPATKIKQIKPDRAAKRERASKNKEKGAKKQPNKPMSDLEKLQLENDKLKDKLKLLVARHKKEKQLADNIGKCEAEVEAAKAVLSGKKEALAAAHQQLLLHANDDGQTSHPALVPKEHKQDDEEQDDQEQLVILDGNDIVGKSDAATLGPKYNVAPDQIITDHAFKADVLKGVIVKDIPTGGKLLQVAPHIISYKACQWLIRDHNPDATRFFAQRVLTKDEWQQTYEQDYGICVEGLDHSDETKAKRIVGGVDCGRVVRVQRNKGVLSPEKEGLVFVFEATPAEQPAKDVRALAANDTTNEEKII